MFGNGCFLPWCFRSRAKWLILLTLLSCSSPQPHNPDFTPHYKAWEAVVDRQELNIPDDAFDGDLVKALDKEKRKYRKYPFSNDMRETWFTREEYVARKKGNCKDVAIAQYFDLLELGVPEDDMFIFVGYLPSAKDNHAVLVVDDEFVLDIRKKKVSTYQESLHEMRELYRLTLKGWLR